MLIRVTVGRGPSPIYVDVQGTIDEDKARRAAFHWAYYGTTNENEAAAVVGHKTTAEELDEYTEAIGETNTVTL